MRRLIFSITFCAAFGCGGSQPPAASPSADKDQPKAEQPAEETPAEQPAEAEPAQVDVPTACDKGSTDPCLMPRAFVKRMCADAYPELALYFFAKDSPWTRIYVSARTVEPFNGMGGPSSDKNLEFDEELIVLSEHSPDLGGMQVSGVGKSYDVLRWDGTCATLQAGEVRLQRPPQPKHADVDWRRLDITVQNALRADEKIKNLAEERRRECKGVTMGAVSAKCENADAGLKARVVQVIRDGFQVPKPERVP